MKTKQRQAIGRYFARAHSLGIALSAACFALTLALGCSRPPTAGTVSATAEADVDADTAFLEVDATLPTADADPPLLDTVKDGASDSGDSQTPDAADAQLNPMCQLELPLPGQPCLKVGEIRCTNLGAFASTLGAGFCARPNFVECSADSNGQNLWKMGDCAALAPVVPSGCGKPSCMIWGTIHRCQPTQFDGSDDAVVGGIKISYGGTAVCPNMHGLTTCGGSYVEGCRSLEELGPIAADVKAHFPKCGQYLDLGYYIFPIVPCGYKALSCPCKNKKPPPPPAPMCAKTEYILQCFVDPADSQPKCQQTCKDVGAEGY